MDPDANVAPDLEVKATKGLEVLLGWTLYGGIGLGLAVVLVLLLLFLLPRPSKRRARGPVLLLLAHLLLLGLLAPLPSKLPLHGWVAGTALFLLLTCIGLSLVVLLTETPLRLVRTPPRIFLDITHGLVYLLALLITLSAAGLELGWLFTGSAVITAVIGLSLRDTLGNLFAGLAIQAQRPFEIGDWIQFDSQDSHIGQVMEINWRATKVVTGDKVEIIVPNGLLSVAPIINYSRPDMQIRRVVYFHAPYHVAPPRVHKIVVAALEKARGVLKDPPPSVRTRNFDDYGVEYSVRFSTDEFAGRGKVESAVRDRIWYALRRQGIAMPVPHQAVFSRQFSRRAAIRKRKRRVARHKEILRCVDFLERLPEPARLKLAARAESRVYDENEVILRQGEPGDELFILVRGEVVVSAQGSAQPSLELTRMGPPCFFGEMSLLTGEPRSASVRATKESTVLVVGKDAFARVLTENPELADLVSETIAQRQANRASKLSQLPSLVTPPGEQKVRLLQRIKEFFAI
jgi:small-conductance mechanosensitive channel